MVNTLLTIGFISLAWGVVTGMAAEKKNRSFLPWFAAGCCLWFVPLIGLFGMKRVRPALQGFDDAEFRVTQVPTTIFPDTRIP
jgi:hypothetical protein